MKTFILLLTLVASTCTDAVSTERKSNPTSTKVMEETGAKEQHWEGSFSNGMKETYLSFDVSADGTQIKNLTFNGYWRCGGKLTKDILGPEESFAIKNGVVEGIIVDKEAYIRYELKAQLDRNKASGTFRMSITGLGCDTYVLKWTATPKG